MKTFNLFSAICFSFLICSSAMGAATAPVRENNYKDTSLELAREVVNFWCSPAGSEMFNIFKDTRNQDVVMDSIGFIPLQKWNFAISSNKFEYYMALSRRILEIGGASVFANESGYEVVSRSLSDYFVSEWISVGLLNKLSKTESQIQAVRLANARVLVAGTIGELKKYKACEWMARKSCKKALAQMLMWLKYTALDRSISREIEQTLDRVLGAGESARLKSNAISPR